MKTIYYKVQYNDGLNEFLSRQVSDDFAISTLKEQLYESIGIKNIYTYNSFEEWESAKNNSF